MKFLARRAAWIAAVATLVLGAAACGGSAESESSRAPASEADTNAALEEAKAKIEELKANKPLELEPLSETPEAGYKVASVTCSAAVCYPGETERAASSLGWDVEEFTYDFTKGPSAMVDAVRRALQTDPDALVILFGYPYDTVSDELEQAKDDGVVLIDIAEAIDTPPDGFIACIYCAPGSEGYAHAMVDWAAVEDNGENAGVAVVMDPANPTHQASGEATKERLAELMPDAEVTDIDQGYAKTPQENAQTVITALQRNPSIKYLIYQTPDFLPGVEQALEAAGLRDKVKVTAPGPTTDEQLMTVTEGFPDSWVTTGGGSYYWDVVDVLARNLVGDEFDPTPTPPVALALPENASPDLMYPPDYESSYKAAWGVE